MSRDSKFTPGPWEVSEDYRDDVCSDSGELLAGCYGMHDDETRKVQYANARLIAAAPELYEALQDFTAAMRKDTTDNRPDLLALINALHKADAALRKAEGKGDEHGQI